MNRENEGKEKIHKLLHVFIEGIAAGVYETVEDVERDAKEYLVMEKVIDKLSNWNVSDTVEDLAKLFDGVVSSEQTRKTRVEKKREWENITEMPKVEDVETLIEESIGEV
jgi:hypothetical protein